MAKFIFEQGKLIFDSNQQYQFYCWLQELQKKQIVKSFICQPQSFKLFQGLEGYNKKGKNKKIIREHVYTSDFYVQFNKDKLFKLFNQQQLNDMFNLTQIIDYEKGIYFQIKGDYNRYASDTNFIINQKWVYQIYKIPIQRVVPTVLFNKSFVPQKVRYTEKRKDIKKKYLNCKTLDQLFVFSTSK